MNKTIITVGKVAIQVVSFAASLAAGYFAKKELDNTITEKVSEALAEAAAKKS